ncbi:MAG: glycosyltransferase [Armatimonadota bacterium]
MNASSPTPRVVAAVMTYNRKETLRRCLQSIRAQTTLPAAVLVVDNASTDGTAEMLAQEFSEMAVHRTAENTGCAGAMHESLRIALTMSPDYIWLFDDDVIALPNCLETLVREMRSLERDRRIGILRGMFRDPNSEETVGSGTGGGMSTAGLLRAEMVAALELPRSELFIELSDHHYNAMVRRAGYEILRVPVVLALHPVDRLKSFREIVSEGYRVKPWRLYYAVRNRVYFSLYVRRSFTRFVSHLVTAARSIVLLTVFGRPRRGQTLVLRGIVDGMLGRLGRRVEPGY